MSDEIPPNSALDVKLDYIQKDVGEIKKDVKEIKDDYPNRRELNDALVVIRDDIKFLKRIVWSVIAFVFLAVGGALLALIFK